MESEALMIWLLLIKSLCGFALMMLGLILALHSSEHTTTGLTIYNPVNLASMIKGMKNTTMTREQKIALRMEYEKKESVN